MIYVPNVWPKPCPKRHSFRVWTECQHTNTSLVEASSTVEWKQRFTRANQIYDAGLQWYAQDTTVSASLHKRAKQAKFVTAFVYCGDGMCRELNLNTVQIIGAWDESPGLHLDEILWTLVVRYKSDWARWQCFASSHLFLRAFEVTYVTAI